MSPILALEPRTHVLGRRVGLGHKSFSAENARDPYRICTPFAFSNAQGLALGSLPKLTRLGAKLLRPSSPTRIKTAHAVFLGRRVGLEPTTAGTTNQSSTN